MPRWVKYLADTCAQPRAVLGDGGERRGFREDLQAFLRRRECDGMRRESAAMHHALAQLSHDVFATGEHRDRVTVGHGLGEGAQVGLDAEQFLATAARHPEAGLDLVDDHDDAVLVAQLTRRMHELARRGDRAAIAHDGLDQERGDFVAVGLEDALEAIGIVHRRGVDQRTQHAGDAGGVGHEVRFALDGTPVFHRRVPECRIEHAVVAAFDDHV